MRNKVSSIFLALLLIALSAAGQNDLRSFLYFETGFDGIGGYAPEKDYIRAMNSSYFFADHFAESIHGMMMIPYAGVRYERMISGNFLGISGGLRYSIMYSFIGRPSCMTGSDDYFYVNYNENGTDTEYARVTELNQKTGYVGIPLELRMTPGKDRFIKVFFKAGFSFNFKLHSASNVVFYDDSMNQYKNEVLGLIEDPAGYYSAFNLGGGLKIGRNTGTSVILGMNAPALVLIPGNDEFVKPVAGGGISLIVRIPFKKEIQ
jgi:hypothetical protein